MSKSVSLTTHTEQRTIKAADNQSEGVMASKSIPLVPLKELENGQEADVFVLMTSKEELTTRDGKPSLFQGSSLRCWPLILSHEGRLCR
jgi:hypothetical protein